MQADKGKTTERDEHDSRPFSEVPTPDNSLKRAEGAMRQLEDWLREHDEAGLRRQMLPPRRR